MTTIAAPRPRTTPIPSPSRDTGIDLVRALCVVVVVVIHGLQVGVTLGPAGPVLEYATRGAPWYAPLTWILQVMPIFFVIAGFAGALAHRRGRDRGGTDADFVTGRVHRLLVPAVITIAAIAVALAVLTSLGVPADLLRLAGFRYGEPLWFLGVFLAVQALLPTLLRAHERAAIPALVGLLAGAVLIDVLRGVSGVDAVGYLNLAFVWLALQQLGFFLAEGRIDALTPKTRVLSGTAAVLLLVVTVAAGIFSPDLIANLNPPTTALLLLGIAQTAALSLLRGPLRTLSRRPRLAAFTDFVTARTMTIYLWNMSVLLTMAGVAAVIAMNGALALPEPSSIGWWLSRPLWLAVALVLTAGLAAVLGSSERRRMPRPTRSPRRALQAVLLGLAGVLLLLLAGTTPVTAAIALVLLLTALARIRAKEA